MLDIPFFFATPLAILGLVTLLIPLAIHLLSKARPRLIAFANIAFIKVKTSPLLRQLRLTQLFLLALRMLMLLLATLILAQVYWQSTHQQVDSHILLTKDWLNHATDTEKQKLLELAYDSNFVLVSTQNRSIDRAQISNWTVDNQSTPSLNIWSKVANYSATQPTNSAISVHTTNRLKQFIGKQIPSPKHVKWHIKEIPTESLSQDYSINLKVIYDNSSESVLVYLRAAFAAIKTHKRLNLIIDYTNKSQQKYNSEHSPNYDKIINLTEQKTVQQLKQTQTQPQSTLLTLADLIDVKQADFAFTLARFLFSSKSEDWWLENSRLTAAQITQYSSSDENLNTLSANKESLNKITHSTSLHVWLALMLVAIFMLERVLSEWPKRRLKAELGQ